MIRDESSSVFIADFATQCCVVLHVWDTIASLFKQLFFYRLRSSHEALFALP